VPIAILYFAWVPGYGMNWSTVSWWSAIAVLLFSFVLIHELGHALAAKSRGVQAEKIILFPLGGGAYLPEQPKQLWAEVFVYAAGPLANILLAIIAWGALLTRPDGELLVAFYLKLSGNLVVMPSIVDQLLGLTLAVNLLLAVGNLLPAYPLDGGRILRALLRRPFGVRASTVIVTLLGVIIGLGLAWLGYHLGDPLLVIGAGFIIFLSVMEYRNGWQRRRLVDKSMQAVLRVPQNSQPRIYPGNTVAETLLKFEKTGWPVLPVFDQWNEQLGFVEAATLREEAGDAQALVRAFCEDEFVTAAPDENLLAVTERIVDANVYGATVTGPRGQLIGYVFTEDVMILLDTPFRRMMRRLRG
jgi:Zn-dependent protease